MFFVLLRLALAVLLLSDFSIESTHTEVYESPVLDAGLSPINTTLTQSYGFNDFALIEFFWYYNTIFSDTRNVRTLEPLNCPPGEACSSYFLPGTPEKLVAGFTQLQITTENFTDATWFIQHDAPGYQIDFSAIEREVPPMHVSDCKLYGASSSAVQICLKSVNTSFMAGTSTSLVLLTPAWNACPEATSYENSCLNKTDWRLEGLLNTNMTISERRATTVFDRSNLTIVDIVDISEPTPTNYTPDDFFTFYDILFSVNETDPSYNVTPQFLLIRILVEDINANPLNWFDIGAAGGVSKLQQLLTTIPLVFNSMYWQFPFSSNIIMGKSIALAVPRYRVATPMLYRLSLVGHRALYILFLYCRGIVFPGMVPRNTGLYIMCT